MSSNIIGDSSAFFSLVIKKDQNHSNATTTIREIIDNKASVIVPGEVFTELVNILGKKVNHLVAIKTGKMILQKPELTIIETTDVIRGSAFEKFKEQPKSVSFTDCIVMAFADHFETQEIFGFDEAFKKNGYVRIGIDRV